LLATLLTLANEKKTSLENINSKKAAARRKFQKKRMDGAKGQHYG
jgi:hypothetical protein